MKKIKLVILLFVPFLFFACGAFKTVDMNKLTIGMSKDEVRSVIGDPDRVLFAGAVDDGYEEVVQYRTVNNEIYAVTYWNNRLESYEFLHEEPNYPPGNAVAPGPAPRPPYQPNPRPPANRPGTGNDRPGNGHNPGRPGGNETRPGDNNNGRPNGNTSRPGTSENKPGQNNNGRPSTRPGNDKETKPATRPTTRPSSTRSGETSKDKQQENNRGNNSTEKTSEEWKF